MVLFMTAMLASFSSPEISFSWMIPFNSSYALATIASFVYYAKSLYSGFLSASVAIVFASSNIFAARRQAPCITDWPIFTEIAFKSTPFSNSF